MDTTFTALTITAFLTATLSGVLGMGGGILLLAVMAGYFPPAVAIPFHGAVQLASNVTRAAISWRDIAWHILGPMVAGSILGALVGSQIAITLPEASYQFLMGAFILVFTWLPKFKSAPRIWGKFFWVGGVSTALSFIVGATGPLVAPFFLKEDLTKESIVATKAGGQATTHLLKVGVFSVFGFQLQQHWPLFLSMTAAVLLGTILGKALLNRLPERAFLLLFRALITILAGRMLIRSLIG